MTRPLRSGVIRPADNGCRFKVTLKDYLANADASQLVIKKIFSKKGYFLREVSPAFTTQTFADLIGKYQLITIKIPVDDVHFIIKCCGFLAGYANCVDTYALCVMYWVRCFLGRGKRSWQRCFCRRSSAGGSLDFAELSDVQENMTQMQAS